MSETPSALSVLFGSLNTMGIVRTGVALAGEIRRGDPFAHLGKAWSRQEAACRGQARPVVWLYRALLTHMSPPQALALTTEVVATEGARFIRSGLGDTDLASFEKLSAATAQRKVRGWLDHFFTATTFIESIDPAQRVVRFKVSSCALARLTRNAGHAELAGAFCAADRRYFSAQQPPITLKRPKTIAAGDTVCEFTLSTDAD